MKKITLALCACAMAFAGLLVSCSSGSVDYVDCGKTESRYIYAVYGTITTTSSEEGLIDVSSYSGNISQALDKDGKKSTTTSSSTKKVSNGYVAATWNTYENRESNFTHYTIKGDYKYTSTSNSSGTYDGDSTGSTEGNEDGTSSIEFNIYDIDGTYYLYDGTNKTQVKLEDLAISEDEDAFSGDFGDEFSLNIKISNDKFQKSYTKDNDLMKDAKYAKNSTTEYKLTFVPVQDFDPEDAAEADE